MDLWIYLAPCPTHRALGHGSHSFTCKLHYACRDSPATEHHRPLAGTHFTVPHRVEGWVDLGGWLHTEIKFRLRESKPGMVTHPSTNRARRRVTLFIRPTPLPLRHAATALLLSDVRCALRTNDASKSFSLVGVKILLPNIGEDSLPEQVENNGQWGNQPAPRYQNSEDDGVGDCLIDWSVSQFAFLWSYHWVFLCVHHPTVSTKASTFRAFCRVRSFVRLFGQILSPQYLVNALNNFNKTDGE